jgi:hypothetical protein
MSSSKIFIDPLVGNVGIGVANPTAKLHVLGNARIEGNLIVNGSQTIIDTDVQTTERLDITNNGTGPALRVNQSGASDVIDIQDNGVSVLKILDGGNVGIGTDNPQAKLHVNGSMKVSDKIVNDSGRPMLNQTGGVLQVKNGYVDLQSTTSATVLATATITPSSTSSKILIIASMNCEKGGGDIETHLYVYVRRNTNNLLDVGNAMGFRMNVSARQSGSATFMDSPGTTSAITYDIYDTHNANAGSTIYYWRACGITLMEIAG